MANDKNRARLKHHRSRRVVLLQQWLYAWSKTKDDLYKNFWSTLLTIMVIAISLTLPSTCYLLWKNTHIAAEQWYPTPQLTVYFDLTLSDADAAKIAEQLRLEDGIKSMTFLTRSESLREFREWSGFDEALNMLPDNPLPSVALLYPDDKFNTSEQLAILRERVLMVDGVSDVRLDDGWFTRLTALTQLVAIAAGFLATLMVAAVFLVISNSIRLNIFSRRQSINVMKLIGATDGFIMRPFLNNGAILGFIGAIFAIIMSGALLSGLASTVTKTATAFSTTFHLESFNWEEILILLLVSTMIGWLAAWLATAKHLNDFSPH